MERFPSDFMTSVSLSSKSHQTGASFSSIGKWGKVSYLFSWLRGGDLTIYYGVSYGSLDTAPKISNQPSVRSCLSMIPQVREDNGTLET